MGTAIRIRLISSSDSWRRWRRARPACLTTVSDQLPAATDEPTLRVVFAHQRRDLHCRRDVHRRHLHSGAIRGAILSATSPASTFRFRPSPTTSSRFNFELNFEIGLCLVTTCATPRALWAATEGAAHYNLLARASRLDWATSPSKQIIVC